MESQVVYSDSQIPPLVSYIIISVEAVSPLASI